MRLCRVSDVVCGVWDAAALFRHGWLLTHACLIVDLTFTSYDLCLSTLEMAVACASLVTRISLLRSTIALF